MLGPEMNQLASDRDHLLVSEVAGPEPGAIDDDRLGSRHHLGERAESSLEETDSTVAELFRQSRQEPRRLNQDGPIAPAPTTATEPSLEPIISRTSWAHPQERVKPDPPCP